MGQDKGEIPASSKVVIGLMGGTGLFGKGYEVHPDNWYISLSFPLPEGSGC